MQPARRRKLMMVLFAVATLAVVSGLVLYALRQNISLFYSPTQVVAGAAPLQHSIRVGGMVEKGSVVREKQGLEVQFNITDFSQTITVHYRGILPDLFREGQGIVAEGVLKDKQHFVAQQVLAKHDANYMPPQVKEILAAKEQQ